MRLGVVAPVADHRIAAATGAAHALGPAVLAHQREALGVVQQGREIDQVDCCHDGDGSSHEPVSYSYSRLEARPPSAPRPGPHLTTPEADKSHKGMAPEPLFRLDPPPRSFAADAHGCIMVRPPRGPPDTSSRRDDPRPMANSPRISS